MTENTALSETLTVFGTVQRTDGPPVAEAVVTLADMAGRKIGSAYTGMDGEYRLTVNKGGTYLIIASAPGHEPIASLVAVGAGTVRHDMTIAGVGGLIGIVATARSTEGGGFSFISLPEGGYTLVASCPGQRPVAAAVTVRQGTQTRQDLELLARGALNGEVLLHDRPCDGARLTLMDQAGSIVGTAVSSADGEFSFDDLEPGTYTVVAAGHGPAAVPVHITGGRPVEADVTLTV
jgi:Carboxypeptidase regulatory-like domain